MRLVFDVQEGDRVAIGQVVIDGNKRFDDKAVVKHMATRPEGFWWFQNGEYDDRKVDQDVRERLPRWYADQGFVDFQVTHDSLIPDSVGGKAVLQLNVDEGQQYNVGTFDIEGNRRFSTEESSGVLPLRPGRRRRHAIGRRAAIQPVGLGVSDGEGAEPVRQQRIPLRPDRADGGPPNDRRWEAPDRSALGHPGRVAGHDQQDRDCRQRRHSRAGDPGSDRHAARRSVQPRPADPLVSERLQPRLLPAAAPVARREAGGQRRGCGRHVPSRGAPHREHQLWCIARPGNGRRRFPGARGAEPLRPGKARQVAVAVRITPQRFHAQLYRSGHSGESDLGDRLALRLARPVHHRRPRDPEAHRRLAPAGVPISGIPVHTALHLLLLPARALQRRLGGLAGAVQLQRMQPLVGGRQHSARHPVRASRSRPVDRTPT